jgi:hypothetical protein
LLLALPLVALAGCRCAAEPPADLLELVPDRAAFVLSLDLAALRRAKVMAALPARSAGAARAGALGFDPTRDLDRALVAAASSRGDLDYLVVLTGRLSREAVLAALRRRGGELLSQSQRGQTVYRDKGGRGPQLIFLKPPSEDRAVVTLVSPSWGDVLLDRLEGRGRSVLSGNKLLAPEIRGVSGQRSSWVVSHLAGETGRHLASRVGWPELARLVTLRGSIAADEQLRLELAARLDDPTAAQDLTRRLRDLSARTAWGLAFRVERREREVQVRVALSSEQVRQLLAAVRRP